jgi:hypothetical protein
MHRQKVNETKNSLIILQVPTRESNEKDTITGNEAIKLWL